MSESPAVNKITVLRRGERLERIVRLFLMEARLCSATKIVMFYAQLTINQNGWPVVDCINLRFWDDKFSIYSH